MTNQNNDAGSEFLVRARLTGLHRVWELWRRVARDVMVVVRHVVLYLVARLRGRPMTAARHTRIAIEELGPTAIKLGQMLSTRDGSNFWERSCARRATRTWSRSAARRSSRRARTVVSAVSESRSRVRPEMLW